MEVSPRGLICYNDLEGGSEESHETPYQYSQCQGRDLNPGSTRYEAGMPTTVPRHFFYEQSLCNSVAGGGNFYFIHCRSRLS